MEDKKVILITGASRGIGRALAFGLAQNNSNIVIANYIKSEAKAMELKEDLKKSNINIDIFKADVSKRDDIKAMIEFVISKYGKIDVLINNAGISFVKMFTDVLDDEWNYVVNTNLYSVFATSQETLKYMVNRKNGVIINISSIFGVIGASCESIYAMTKAGIDGLTKSLAKEYSFSNIRVNSIAPGLIDTDMNGDLTEEDIKSLEEEIPLRRIGKPEELLSCVNMLIENEYITGQVIEINGGWHM